VGCQDMDTIAGVACIINLSTVVDKQCKYLLA